MSGDENKSDDSNLNKINNLYNLDLKSHEGQYDSIDEVCDAETRDKTLDATSDSPQGLTSRKSILTHNAQASEQSVKDNVCDEQAAIILKPVLCSPQKAPSTTNLAVTHSRSLESPRTSDYVSRDEFGKAMGQVLQTLPPTKASQITQKQPVSSYTPSPRTSSLDALLSTTTYDSNSNNSFEDSIARFMDAPREPRPPLNLNATLDDHFPPESAGSVESRDSTTAQFDPSSSRGGSSMSPLKSLEDISAASEGLESNQRNFPQSVKSHAQSLKETFGITDQEINKSIDLEQWYQLIQSINVKSNPAYFMKQNIFQRRKRSKSDSEDDQASSAKSRKIVEESKSPKSKKLFSLTSSKEFHKGKSGRAASSCNTTRGKSEKSSPRKPHPKFRTYVADPTPSSSSSNSTSGKSETYSPTELPSESQAVNVLNPMPSTSSTNNLNTPSTDSSNKELVDYSSSEEDYIDEQREEKLNTFTSLYNQIISFDDYLTHYGLSSIPGLGRPRPELSCPAGPSSTVAPALPTLAEYEQMCLSGLQELSDTSNSDEGKEREIVNFQEIIDGLKNFLENMDEKTYRSEILRNLSNLRIGPATVEQVREILPNILNFLQFINRLLRQWIVSTLVWCIHNFPSSHPEDFSAIVTGINDMHVVMKYARNLTTTLVNSWRRRHMNPDQVKDLIYLQSFTNAHVNTYNYLVDEVTSIRLKLGNTPGDSEEWRQRTRQIVQ